MKVFIGLISSNQVVNIKFKEKKSALIPKDIRNKFPKDTNFIFEAFDPCKSTMPIDLYLLSRTREVDAAAIFIQRQNEKYCASFKIPFFAATIDIPEDVNINIYNFFGRNLSKLLKGLRFVLDLMDNLDQEVVMRLPIRNFVADELKQLCLVFENETLGDNFNDQVLSFKEKLISRKRPRRKSSYNKKYFVDDHEKHFEFGKETHSVLDTASPHLPSCEIAGNFRFGKKISTNKHYNVSKGDGDNTNISGTFLNCHDETNNISKTTHINMFTNDFF